MDLTPADMDRKMDEHFGFEARDDVAGVLSTLAPDVLHDVVGWNHGPAHGRENARPFYEALFKDLADGQTTCIRRLYAEKFLVDESIWRGSAVGRPFGLEGRGRPLEFRLLHVMEFSDEGQIQRETVWTDMAAIVRQLSQG
jgi:uncharacterized protein